MVGFLFGGDTKETPESIKRKRDIVRALMGASAPKNIGEGINALGDGIVSAVLNDRANKAETEGRKSADSDFSALSGMFGGDAPASMPSPGAAAELSSTSPAPPDLDGNDVYKGFIDTVRTGVTNPYGLAAVAATGRAESGFSPKNVNRTWDDPSESGQPGRAGGIMSWRGPRYNALASTGDLSPAGQAKFFLQENPQLIKSLNEAKSVEEAQRLMNNAWAFKGYDRPGGEAGRRLGYAQGFLPKFQGQGDGQKVASLDPSAGMTGATQTAPQPQAYVDPMVVSRPQPAPPPLGSDGAGQPAPQQQAELPPQQDMNALPALPAPVNVATPPVPPNAMPPQNQVAQALRQPPPRSNAELQAAQKVLSNQFSSEGQKAVAQALLRQEMSRRNAEEEMRLKQRDPAYQLGLEKDRLSIDQMRNPRISPIDQRRLEMEQQKQDFDRNGISAADKAKMDMERQKFELDKQKAGNTSDISEYKFYEERAKAAGQTPMSPDQFWATQKKSGATNVTTNVGETDKFYENLDKKNAETFSALSTTGMQARGKLGQIDRLDALLSQSPQGAEGAIKQWLGDLGVKTEGLDAIQSTRALLEKMVPEQRAPGSGTMSDADIVMFRNSLPRVINQQGGNQVILQTMRGIAQYEQQMGDIADAVADRSISPAEGRAKIRDLKNPLSDYNNLIREKGLDAAKPKSGAQPGSEPPSGSAKEVPLDDLLKKYGG